MKNKGVTLPPKAYYAQLEGPYKVSFYANDTDEANEKLTNLKLPGWFGLLIEAEIKHRSNEAVDSFKRQVKGMFN